MVANMDCTGTFEMATRSVYKHKLFTCIHKYYSLDDWKLFRDAVSISDTPETIFEYIAVSLGPKEEDFEKLQSILRLIPQIQFICLDVANGYTEHFVSFVMMDRLASIK